MSLLTFLGVSTAYAAEAGASAAAPHKGNILSMLPMLILIALVFYFLLIRPQQKRARAQKALINNIAMGDEIVTIGGIVGKVVKMRDHFLDLSISRGVEMTIRKAAVESILPKGTIKDNSKVSSANTQRPTDNP